MRVKGPTIRGCQCELRDGCTDWNRGRRALCMQDQSGWRKNRFWKGRMFLDRGELP